MRVHGRRQQASLTEAAAHLGQPGALLLRLDALGDDVGPNRAREVDDDLGELPSLGLGDGVHVGLVDLQREDGELAEAGRPGVSGPSAEVIDHQPDADVLELPQRRRDPLVAAQQRPFRQL